MLLMVLAITHASQTKFARELELAQKWLSYVQVSCMLYRYSKRYCVAKR